MPDWRRASSCDSASCVEVATACNGGECVEVSFTSRCEVGDCVEVHVAGGVVLVRDSKRPDQQPVPFFPLTFDQGEIDEFIRGARAGEFNLPREDP